MDNQKPHTQAISVSGIFTNLFGEKKQQNNIDWDFICSLPPFQTYVRQTGFNRHKEADQNAYFFIQSYQGNLNTLWDSYSSWHKKTGKWKNETPDGKPL